MSQAVDEMLEQLEKDIPRLCRDLNKFHARFEERAFKIFEVEDSERVQERLMKMVSDAGLS